MQSWKDAKKYWKQQKDRQIWRLNNNERILGKTGKYARDRGSSAGIQFSAGCACAQVAGNGQSDSENGGSTNYKDGTYTGEADGFGGTIQVEVKIEKSKIAEINVISAEKEDGAYLSMAKDIIPKIIDAQSADIDTISGATFSSTGIKNASEQALEKAVK